MQHILEALLPYIFLLYVLDCLCCVKAHQVLLASLFGRKFVLKGSGLHPAGLLPTSQTILIDNLPICYTKDGIYLVLDNAGSHSRIEKAEDFDFLKFQDLKLVEVEGQNIKLNQTHTIRTPSSASARFTAEFINNIRILNAPERIEKIKARLSNSFDLQAVKKIEASGSKPFSIIKILSSYLFLVVFFILPTVLYAKLYEYINLNALVFCISLFYFLLLAAAFLTLKKLYRFDSEFRSYTFLSIIFSPVNAMHVLSYLTKNLYFEFNYLTLAAYFLPRQSFKELVRKEIALIEHFENEIHERDWQKFWKLKKELIQGLLEDCEIALEEISMPPEKQDQTAAYYCPVCRTEYREKRRNCIDCDMALKEFTA